MMFPNGKSTFQLLIIMIFVSLFVAGTSIVIVYHVVLEEKKEYLKELSENQVGIIKTLYAERKDPNEVLQLIKLQQTYNTTLGKTGEFVIGYGKNDSVFFLLDHLRYDFNNPKPIAFKSKLGEPMKFALSKKTGIIRGIDYSNNEVLAYCTYIPELKWGVVTKINVSEVIEPFTKAGIITSIIAIILVTLATFIFRRISDPIIKELIRSKEEWEETFNLIPDLIAILDDKHNIVRANKAMLEKLGASSNEIVGNPCYACVHGSDAPPALCPHTMMLKDNKQHVSEIQDVKLGGDYLVSVTPILDEKGNFKGGIHVARDITERKKMEEELHQNQEKLRAILDATQESIYLFDRQGYFVVANRVGAKRLNLTQTVIIKHHFSEFMSPELASSRMEHLSRVFNSGKPLHFEDIRDGLHFEHHFYPCFKVGKVNYVATYSRDITEIKRKELELLKLNRILKALGKSSQAMLKATDELSYLNDICQIIVEDCGFSMVWIGYAQQDKEKTVKPMAYAGFEKGYLDTLNITWEDNERGNGPTGTAIRTGKPAECKNMLTDPVFEPWREQALKRGYASSLVLPLLENSVAFGAITIYSPDNALFGEEEMNFLTELASDLSHGILTIRAKKAHAKAEEELRQSEQRLKFHFENSPLAVVEWNANFIVTHWSIEAERIFGWRTDETIGKRIDSLNIIYKEDAPIVNHVMERLTSGKENTVISSNRNHTKKGSVIECTWYNSILLDDNGQMVSVMSLIDDITERKVIEEALKRSEEQYRKLVEISPYAVFINRNNRITYVNPAAIQLFGATTSEEILGMSPFEIFHPATHLIVKERIEKVLAGESVPIIEIKIVQLNGIVKDVEVTGSKFIDQEGTGIQVILRDITERKQAQAIKTRYQLITEYARDPLLLVGTKGEIIEANRAAEEFYGYTYKELLELKIQDIRKDNPGIIDSQMEQATLKGILFETIHVRKDGTLIPVEVSSRGVTVDGQEMFLSVIRDIAERKKNEMALREHVKMLEHAPVLVRNLDDEIIVWHKGLEKIYGLTEAEAVGKVYHDLLQTQFPEPLEKIFAQLYQHGKWEGELQHIKKDGQPALVLSSWMLYKDEQDKPIAIIEVDKDITKRKQAEKELQESQQKLELALENGSIGVWVWNIITNEIEWDERMEKIFGIAPGSFAKTYDAFEAFLVEEDIPHTRNAIKKALEGDVHFETVYRIRLKNEDTKHISAKALLTKDSKGKPVKMTGVCFDITALKNDAEQVLFNLNAELLRSNKELEQFAYVASHDLQEPLRMVSSFTQLLAQRYKDKLDQDANEFIQFAVDGASRMQILINDLLSYSRIQTRGKEFSDVDMHDVLGKVMYNLNVKIQEKKALITINELPVVHADEGQMVQLLQNLVGNAIKFSLDSPIVNISSKEEKDQYVFSVKDNGIGIEKQYFERIFQIFQRLLPKEEYDGTGIGLAICKRVVERHGGKIWVVSEKEKGTTFYFTIRKTEKS